LMRINNPAKKREASRSLIKKQAVFPPKNLWKKIKKMLRWAQTPKILIKNSSSLISWSKLSLNVQWCHFSCILSRWELN
jgi:hypothetical protein